MVVVRPAAPWLDMRAGAVCQSWRTFFQTLLMEVQYDAKNNGAAGPANGSDGV